MRIVIPGGSGQIGTILARAFQGDGHDVVVLSRQPQIRPWRVAPWDGATLDAWQGEIDRSDVVINLAGRSVNCRYNAANRHEILHSRIASTRVVGEAIAGASGHRTCGCKPSPPPSTRIDTTARMTNDQVCLVATSPTRRAHGGSALMWRRPGSVPSTRQGRRRPGIHVVDSLRGLRRGGALADRTPRIEGIVNVASPNPLANAEFMRVLREACGMPFGLPAPDWMLEIGAAFMRTETELVLKSRRVVPAKLLEHGFRFRFPNWSAAASDLCRQSRAGRGVSRSAA